MMAGCNNRYEEAAKNAALAESLLTNGNLVEARESIQRALIARDDVAEYFVLLARIELAAQQPVNAFNAYSRALDLQADNPEILLNIAELGLRTGRLKEAAGASDRLLLLFPGTPRALLVKGLIAIEDGRLEEANEVASTILARNPSDIGGTILAARLSALDGRFDDAISILTNAREKTNDQAPINAALLEVYRAQGNASGMLSVFPGVVKQSSALSGDYELDFINFLYKTNDVPGARAQAVTAIERRPSDRGFLTALAALFLEYDAAPFSSGQIASYSQNGTGELQLVLARFFFETGQYETAQELLKLPLAGKAKEAQALLARILIAQKRNAEADQLIAVVLKGDPRNPDTLLARSARNLSRGRIEAAIEDANIVSSDAPQEYAGYVALAKAQLGKGVEVRARQIYERGVSALPQNAQLVAAYEEFLREREDNARIVSLYDGLAMAKPSSVKTWEAYKRVCAEFGTVTCRRKVELGMAAAQRRFFIDDAPGTPRQRGIFSRILPEQICNRTGGVCQPN